MNFPKRIWLLWAPGMSPWPCFEERDVAGQANFMRDNGASDIEVQSYTVLGPKRAISPMSEPTPGLPASKPAPKNGSHKAPKGQR